MANADRTPSVSDIAGDLARYRAMAVRHILAQHYDAGGITRRTHGWMPSTGDPNAISGFSLRRLANVARDLVRNNGHAQSALQVIKDDVVGRGIRASVQDDRWLAWADSQQVDADCRCNLAGLQAQAMRTVVESGACLIRRRRRRLSDGLPLPLQLQLLEPDLIDTEQHRTLPGGVQVETQRFGEGGRIIREKTRVNVGGRIVRGIELSPIGRRVAYWLLREHPGSSLRSSATSVRVPAESILHIYRPGRPGQVHDATWFAPVLLRFRDFDEYSDATLMAKKVQAAFAAFVSDLEGEPLGAEDDAQPDWDFIEPGTIKHLKVGSSVDFPRPPQIRDHESYSMVTLREVAAGIGVTYEDMTGDYTKLPFSAARLSRLRHFARVSGWRWRMLIPQMLDGIWTWAVDAARLAGHELPESTDWTAPGLPMIEPDKEGLAILRNMRAGITTLSNEIRARGFNVDQFLDELQADFEELDRRGLILDSDPRKMTQAGQIHGTRDSGSTVPAGGRLEDAISSVSEFLGQLPPDLVERIVDHASRAEAA